MSDLIRMIEDVQRIAGEATVLAHLQQQGLTVGRVYPLTAAAPVAPSPCTTVQIGPPQRTYTQAEVDAAVLAERKRIAAWLDCEWAADAQEERAHRRYCAAKLLGDGA